VRLGWGREETGWVERDSRHHRKGEFAPIDPHRNGGPPLGESADDVDGGMKVDATTSQQGNSPAGRTQLVEAGAVDSQVAQGAFSSCALGQEVDDEPGANGSGKPDRPDQREDRVR